MKVFLGWSGDTSHNVALALHDWIPKVIQAVKPYVSSEDIAKGARWSTEIANELQTSSFGIICITKENEGSPWINFEAGALSKEINKSFVTPFLFNMKSSEIQGPLAQFQAVLNSKEDIEKLVSSINNRQELERRLEKADLKDAFETRWPFLKERLNGIAQDEGQKTTPHKIGTEEILEELLDIARAERRDQNERWEEQDINQRYLFEQQTMRIDNLAAQVSALARSVETLHHDDDTRLRSITKLSAMSVLAGGGLGQIAPPPSDKIAPPPSDKKEK
jgi:hypothetical protein